MYYPLFRKKKWSLTILRKIKSLHFLFMRSAKIPLLIAIPILLLTSAFVILARNYYNKKNQPAETTSAAKPCNTDLKIYRDKSKTLTSPMFMYELPEQSPALAPLKNRIQELIKKEYDTKNVNDISLYLVAQNSGEWIGINNKEQYNSSGYVRLAILITYLKMAEENPNVMTQSITFKPENTKVLTDSSLVLKSGTSYSVRELLRYLILTPDTNPKRMLADHIDKNTFRNLFDILGMQFPDFNNRKYTIDVTQYSKFLQLLYNGRYLNENHSEYALQLLSEQSKRNGILKLLPTDSKAIHKISERFVNNSFELRESGIIYRDYDSYVLTIFGRGNNRDALDAISGSIAKIVYDNIAQ